MSQLVRFLIDGHTPGVLMNLPAVSGVNGRFSLWRNASPLHIAAI
ncbi:hypothetical protein [Robbsia betulipollinis]|nr:hypothetical protein [Robbsia betulipollinis]